MIQSLKKQFLAMDYRNRRAICIGMVLIALIFVYMVVFSTLENRRSAKKSIAGYVTRLNAINAANGSSKIKMARLYKSVPFSEFPEIESAQRKLFWDKVYDQIKKSGLDMSDNPEYMPISKKKDSSGYRLLKLKLSGKGDYSQVLTFLGSLQENPFLVSVEEFSIKGDQKQKDKVEVDMVLSTYTK